MSITPLDSIRRAIARRNGVADPAVAGSGTARAQGGRIENGLFPASHTAEELARIQELSQRNAGGPDSSQATRRRRRERDREPGPVRRMVNAWWNRLLGAVYGGGFSMQEAEYEEHATSRDIFGTPSAPPCGAWRFHCSPSCLRSSWAPKKQANSPSPLSPARSS